MTDEQTRSTGVSRRAVLRTGGHAAWVVPAVVAVSAAPAHAGPGSGGAGGLYALTTASTSFVTNPAPGQRMDFRGSLRNDGSAPVTGRLIVTSVLTVRQDVSAWVASVKDDSGIDAPGWDGFGADVSNASQFVCTWTRTAAIGPGDTVVLPPFFLRTGGGPTIGYVDTAFQVVVDGATTTLVLARAPFSPPSPPSPPATT